MKKLHQKTLIISSVVTILLLVLYLIFRNQFLTEIVKKKVDGFNKNREVSVHYKNVYFKGLGTVCFDSLFVTSNIDDTVFSTDYLSAAISLRHLVSGHIRFRKLHIVNTAIRIEQGKIYSYYKSSSKSKTENIPQPSRINLYSKSGKLLKQLFTAIPSKLIIENASAVYIIDAIQAGAHVDMLTLKRGKLSATVKLIINDQIQTSLVEGNVNPGKRQIALSITPENGDSMIQSPLASIFGAKVLYKSLKMNFAETSRKGDVLRMEGNYTIDRFDANHKALSSKNITFSGCSLKLNLCIGTNYIELDSISNISIGELAFHPYLKYTLRPTDSVTLACYVPDFTVDQFFSSLPPDLFVELKDIEAEGSLSYRAKLDIDLKKPDSLLLESNLKSNGFNIKHINKELSKMNFGFSHTAYEEGIPVRVMTVGPENSNFRPLEQIPELLQNGSLMAEDDLFYWHNGFRNDAIRYAIAQNLKKGQLFRGGSTISQQLIKNIYLSREKTISRKLEEIILVWLIESNRLVSKKRMYEVYLNIIEWGPNVYGVNEAAHFYFQKDIQKLSPAECIFLASVIPSPKKFYYRFNKEGKLAPFMINYYNNISGKMQWRGYIDTANGDSLASLLKITGPAKKYLHSAVIAIDSMPFIDPVEIKSLNQNIHIRK